MPERAFARSTTRSTCTQRFRSMAPTVAPRLQVGAEHQHNGSLRERARHLPPTKPPALCVTESCRADPAPFAIPAVGRTKFECKPRGPRALRDSSCWSHQIRMQAPHARRVRGTLYPSDERTRDVAWAASGSKTSQAGSRSLWRLARWPLLLVRSHPHALTAEHLRNSLRMLPGRDWLRTSSTFAA